MKNYAAILSDEVVKKALAGACVILHGQAVRYAPIDTGLLRNSISWSIGGGVEGLNQGGGGTIASSDDGVEVPSIKHTGHVGSNVEYAAAVEFGRPDMPSYPMQPYLRPAVATTKAKRLNFVSKIIAREIMKAVGE